ncbi:unnamed protein product, partial [Rhizoctonia solani]
CVPLSSENTSPYIPCPNGYQKDPFRTICIHNTPDPKIECKPDEWVWPAKQICIPLVKAWTRLTSPPDGSLFRCPKSWDWDDGLKHCKPRRYEVTAGECDPGYIRDDFQFKCISKSELVSDRGTCDLHQWLWKTGTVSICFPDGGSSSSVSLSLSLALTPTKPNNIECPKYWYWVSSGHCAPPWPKDLGSDCPTYYRWNRERLYCD